MSRMNTGVPGEAAVPCLLCIDDDPEILKLRKLLLEASGYSVITATSGEAGLRIAAENDGIDLVLLDYLMPGMNGDVVAEKLHNASPLLPVIAISAVGQLPASLTNRADATIQKGQDPEILLSTIATVLRRRGRDHCQTGSLPSAPTKTVLCVEDEPLQLKLRKALFESAGYVVLTAASPEAALEAFRTQHIDAIVMDYWMSGQKGTELADEMKRIRPRTPIIMLSGYASLPGESAVVDSWLRKAEIEPEDLLNEVERLIELRSGTQQSVKPA